jgi:DNA repair exonuclease SbcCD ATPase subunit
MRLITASIRNYRLHRDLKIDFDASRMLIGGPNETGKSTLIEAIHRALFLKAKGNTELHRSMESSLHPGPREVELVFEAGGIRYELKKRFGSSGTASLVSKAGSFTGDAAETELARILGVEAGAAGKVAVSLWSHLWVWQGQSGDDPSAHATAQRDGLLRRLQAMGGAAALQSDLDTRVAARFASLAGQIFVQSGKARTGSDLEKAESARVAAQEALAAAVTRVRNLEAAETDLEGASRELSDCGASLATLEKQQEATEAKARQLAELRQLEAVQSAHLKAERARYEAMGAAHRQILAARADIAALEESLKPQDEVLARLETASREAKYNADAAEVAVRLAAEQVRATRFRQGLAAAYASLFERTEVHTKLAEKAQRVAKLQADRAGLAEHLAKLPKLDKAKLHKIQKLETECSNALASLRAMATGIAVVACDLPVAAGEKTVEVGQEQILTETTEVRIGQSIRLRIQPGGGTSLAAARKCEADARADLQAALDALGLQAVREAIDAHAGREDTLSRIKSLEAELDGMDAGGLEAELQRAFNELTATKAEVARLAPLAADLPMPEGQVASVALARALQKTLGESERHEADANTARERCLKALDVAERVWREAGTQAQLQQRKLHGLGAQLDLLLATHGDDAARGQGLVACRILGDGAQDLLRATTEAIAALQPELLEGDRARLVRALRVGAEAQSEARSRIAVAKAALHSDGSDDPAAALVVAQARERAASQQHALVKRRADGVALLSRLFGEEQGNLARKFTQPFAEKISGYLQCLFGAGVEATVTLVDNEFGGLSLARPGFGGAPFGFSTLSGGAQEQTAAAVRLAMAEVLAQDHGGCLPVVFDDAFAYSDPQRVNQLQRMLDLAATRGLQVIVLTCNPADYISLGAKTLTLQPQRHNVSACGNADSAAGGAPVQASIADPAEPPLFEHSSVAVTDELRQKFLEVLSGLGGAKGNQTLCAALGWDADTYSAVKNDLVVCGRLIPGKGRGGSVSLPEAIPGV